MAKLKVLICPYCGDTQGVGERCRACGGFFEPLSRQATHNAMGPWFVRDETRPFQPGASYETVLKMIERGQVTKYSIVRSPTTKQFWTVARRVPGLSHVLGYCHNCDASVDPGDHGCHACGVPFGAYLDRNFLGLPDVRPLPWEAGNEEVRLESSSRTMDFHRAAEPLGISSFASDDELRGAGVAPLPPLAPVHASDAAQPGAASLAFASGAQGQTRMYGSAFEQPGTAETHSSTTMLEASDTGVAARSLQRRLAQQQQTIRMLIIAMLVSAAVAIIAFAAWLGARGQDQPADVNTVSQTQDGPATAPARQPLPATAPATQAASQPQTPPSEIAPPGQPANDEFARAQATYERALELIGHAQDESRPRQDRIIDYDEALALLKQVESSGIEIAVDLNDLISATERELERLKLEEFFP